MGCEGAAETPSRFGAELENERGHLSFGIRKKRLALLSLLQGFSFADRTGAHSCCAIYMYKHFKWRLVGTIDKEHSSNG